jgi:hypothetical protein
VIIYLLQAKGTRTAFPGSGVATMLHKRAFRTREAAEASKVDFLTKCCAGELFDLDPTDLRIAVVEIELEERDGV